MILHWKTMYCCRMTSSNNRPHRERSRHALHHPVWMDYERKISQTGQAISVFHRREAIFASQDLEEVHYDLDKPRITVSKYTWRVHQGTVILVQSEAHSHRRIAVLSNPIARNRSCQHTTCDLY